MNLVDESDVARGPASSSSPALTELAGSLADIKPFPQIVLTIRQAAADPRNGIGDIARLVECDVGVSTNLLRAANAPTSGLAQQCSSIRHAVSLLGLRRVCEVVTSAAALALLETAQRRVPGTATHAIAVAGVARLLAPITGASPDAAFTAGLLHDVGSLLLLQAGEPFYEGLVEQCGEDEEPSPAEERALLGFDHATLGAEVLRHWNLPAPLPQIVALHHDWERALEVGGAVCVMVALIRAADILVRELPRTAEPSLDHVRGLMADPAFAYIGVNGEELLKLWEGLRRACGKASSFGEASPPTAIPLAPPRPALPARPQLGEESAARGPGVWWVGVIVLILAAAGLSALFLY